MRFWNHLRHADRDIATVSLALMILLVVAQVVMRVIFLAPLVGAEELVRYLLIAIVFIGAPFATRSGGQIRMEELQGVMPRWLRYSVRFLSFTSGVVVFGAIAAATILTTMNNLKNRTATLSIPFWVFFLPMIVGFVWLTIESLVLWIDFFKHPDYVSIETETPDQQRPEL